MLQNPVSASKDGQWSPKCDQNYDHLSAAPLPRSTILSQERGVCESKEECVRYNGFQTAGDS